MTSPVVQVDFNPVGNHGTAHLAFLDLKNDKLYKSVKREIRMGYPTVFSVSSAATLDQIISMNTSILIADKQDPFELKNVVWHKENGTVMFLVYYRASRGYTTGDVSNGNHDAVVSFSPTEEGEYWKPICEYCNPGFCKSIQYFAALSVCFMKHFKFSELVDESWYVSDRVVELWATWKEEEEECAPEETPKCVVLLAKALAKPFVEVSK